MLEGLFMFSGLPFVLYFRDPEPYTLLYSGLISLASGFLMWFLTRRAEKRIMRREAYLIVTSAWLTITVSGMIPYLISGAIPNVTDAFFETISGFTTTGASILSDIEALPKGVLYWRAMTHWIGGMGIIVLSVAILPLLGIGGMQLFVAEMPGITPDKLHPRITATAKRLWMIYVGITFAEVIFLMFGGMNFFDALTHSFSTLATGGFANYNTSAANFSPYIQYVIIVFMILAGTNFTLHYFMLTGKWKKFLHNEEYKFYILFTFAFAVSITVLLLIERGGNVEETFREALFQVVSIVTTTGFVSSDYLQWAGHIWIFLFVLMFVGGSAGSTGGGIKVARHIILLKSSVAELKKMIHPQAIVPVRYNKKTVSPEIIHLVLAFFILYLLTFFFGAFVMTWLGLDFTSAVGATIATLGNIGPGIGIVGPVENYAAIPQAGKWFLSFLMLLGRLELFTVLVILSPFFWKK